MKCRVCKRELQETHTSCPYCGYGNAVILTTSGDDSQQYRKELLSSLKNISVQGKKFQYNTDQKAFQEISTVSIFPRGLSGRDYMDRVVRSNEWIAHVEGRTDLKISYEFRGRRKDASVPVQLIEWEGVGYLGLQIKENLCLDLYLCVDNPDTGAATSRIKLKSVDLDFHT